MKNPYLAMVSNNETLTKEIGISYGTAMNTIIELHDSITFAKNSNIDTLPVYKHTCNSMNRRKILALALCTAINIIEFKTDESIKDILKDTILYIDEYHVDPILSHNITIMESVGKYIENHDTTESAYFEIGGYNMRYSGIAFMVLRLFYRVINIRTFTYSAFIDMVVDCIGDDIEYGIATAIAVERMFPIFALGEGFPPNKIVTIDLIGYQPSSSLSSSTIIVPGATGEGLSTIV
jgi:hypothetical protein